MRHILLYFLLILMLCGCFRQNAQLEQGINLRDSIINSNGCAFDVTVTADYQDVYYTFEMSCESDPIGNVTFEILAPKSITGITGIVTAEDGKLTFDDQILLFSTLAEGQITPVCAPWLFINSLRSGYINGYANDGGALILQIDDTYATCALRQNVHIVNSVPSFVEIIWNGRRVVTMDVKSFRLL